MAGRLDKWREDLAGRIFVKGRSGYKSKTSCGIDFLDNLPN